MSNPKHLPTPSASGKIANILRDEIASGKYAAGDMLPAEHILVERFAISRPTCREALRILQSEGLLSPIRGNRGGARVNLPEPEQISSYAAVFLQMRGATVIEVFDARRLIEPEAAARVARVGTSAVFSALAQNVASQHFLVDDRVAFYKAGREFREMLMEHCGSELIRLFGLMLGHIADRQLSMIAHDLPYWEGQEDSYRKAIRTKETLIEALVARDEARARALWDHYLYTYAEDLKRVMPDWLRTAQPFPLE